MKSFYLDSPYPQPVDGGLSSLIQNKHEFVDFLPDTKMRIWYSANNQFYPAHWHEAIEIIYCQSGYYIIETDEKTWHVKEGNILIIPSGIIHSMDMKEDCHGFVYLLELKFLEHIPSASLIQPMITHPLFIKEMHSQFYNNINVILEQMRNEYFSNNNLRELVVYSHLLFLLTQIGRFQINESRKLHQRADKQKEYIDRFSTVLNYINIHFTENITLEQISRHFNFSKYHFSRLFHQYTSYTFSDYLTYQRIKAAESLLIQPNLSITEIAITVGFNNSSTFSRAFKKKKRYTPSEYRQLYKN